ncbi:SDR family oxidoreductase [Anaeromyxobacter dehalogenans]|uniref:Short-chain dehydrogenase/reductase SDR n=1 Tax=Anaeromyxobacter dehalogenans (strain 2CP-C) TaxID=290397 RepID=Q2ILA3_ANADE|nr:SDR family oxidoreductase [Anaeromyxobacter dehalogenans]ABC82430.1 short-chain dehydrogenase/reductase SDR [Anaeromyxobacter dehalogenans 2CP-C]
MRRDLAGKVAVVTGASAGVGRAVARELGRARMRVALVARNGEALENAAREIRAAGGEAIAVVADVSDAAAVEAAADAVARAWGGIDVWVNDAMVSVFAPVMETTAEEYRRVTEVTYLGYVHGTRAALRHMLPHDRGHVVQVGSALCYRSIPLQSAYCAAKAAVRGFTDALRCELAHDRSRVRLSMVHLPAVNTPQFELVRTRLPGHPKPVPPIYQPEVIARAVLAVLRRPRRELWVTWSTTRAILGQRTIPGLLDRYLGRIGYRAQQADRPPEPGRPDDLDRPVPGDHGARGEFSAEARPRSASLWFTLHRRSLAAGAVLLAVGAAWVSRNVRFAT